MKVKSYRKTLQILSFDNPIPSVFNLRQLFSGEQNKFQFFRMFETNVCFRFSPFYLQIWYFPRHRSIVVVYLLFVERSTIDKTRISLQ